MGHSQLMASGRCIDNRRAGLEVAAPLNIVVTTTASDAHTWNLVFLQLLLEEAGHRVVNLGPCVPDGLIVEECKRLRPDLIVISSVNGLGRHDGRRIIQMLRAEHDLTRTAAIIGGKLDTSGGLDAAGSQQLLAAGFDAVFGDGSYAVADLRSFVAALPTTPIR